MSLTERVVGATVRLSFPTLAGINAAAFALRWGWKMDEAKRKCLGSRGWRVGTVDELLGTTDTVKWLLDKLDALTKEAEAKHCLRGTHSMADCVIVGYEPMLQRLRAAVEKMEEEIEHANKSASAWLKLQHAAERERDELREKLKHSKMMCKGAEYNEGLALTQVEAIEETMGDLKRRLEGEGAHTRNCYCAVPADSKVGVKDHRCLALRERKP